MGGGAVHLTNTQGGCSLIYICLTLEVFIICDITAWLKSLRRRLNASPIAAITYFTTFLDVEFTGLHVRFNDTRAPT
jgi:hypothetical protein